MGDRQLAPGMVADGGIYIGNLTKHGRKYRYVVLEEHISTCNYHELSTECNDLLQLHTEGSATLPTIDELRYLLSNQDHLPLTIHEGLYWVVETNGSIRIAVVENNKVHGIAYNDEDVAIVRPIKRTPVASMVPGGETSEDLATIFKRSAKRIDKSMIREEVTNLKRDIDDLRFRVYIVESSLTKDHEE